MESGGVPAWASMFDRAIEKHAACAAAINCSGLDPGPSSKRLLNVYPPPMESPAVNVPDPDFRYPCHSALPLAAMCLVPSYGAYERNQAPTSVDLRASRPPVRPLPAPETGHRPQRVVRGGAERDWRDRTAGTNPIHRR